MGSNVSPPVQKENALMLATSTRTGKIRVTTLLHRHLTMPALGSTNILLRVNGRTRRRLPIACAAPGPCSANLSVPLSTNRGSLNGIHPLTLPFTALLWDVGAIIAQFPAFVKSFFQDSGKNVFAPERSVRPERTLHAWIPWISRSSSTRWPRAVRAKLPRIGKPP